MYSFKFCTFVLFLVNNFMEMDSKLGAAGISLVLFGCNFVPFR